MSKKKIRLSRKELVRRLFIIQEDVESILAWAKVNGVDTAKDNHNGSSHDTFITNIMIASDVDVKGRCDDDGNRVETEWFCEVFDKKYPTALCETPQTFKFVKDVIAKLKVIDVDGETMEYVLEKVGMTDQMLRQLVMHNPYTDTSDLLEEKVELDNQRLGTK